MSPLNYSKGDIFSAAEAFRPARWLAAHITPETQRGLVQISGWTALFFGVISWILYSDLLGLRTPDLVLIAPQIGALLSLLVFFVLGSIHTFFLYYRMHTPVASDASRYGWEYLSYPAADILLSIADAGDAMTGFSASSFGYQVLLRSGLRADEVYTDVVDGALQDLSAELDDQSSVDLETTAAAVFRASNALSEKLLSAGITEDVFLSAARWVQRMDEAYIYQRRFWSRERMWQVPPISQDFAYGTAYTLKKFSQQSPGQEVFLGAGTTDSAFANDIAAVFNTLSRPRDGNVLLVGSPSGGVGDIIAATKSKLQTGDVPAELSDRKLYVLDSQRLIAAAEGQKGQFEYLFDKLLAEATLAGNVVLVIEDIVEFRQAANQISVNLLGMLGRYLDHPELPIICTSTVPDYHEHLEGREIMSSLGSVFVHEVDDTTLLKLLGEVAVANEGQSVCTIGALQAVARGARELITDDKMPHAAVDLFLEIITAHQGDFITKQVVNAYLSDKTGVPTGEISETERKDLANLEENLRRRVIGQDPAVKAVASALRRNRSGVEDQDRPIGTFLFLGPTGVGKTETAKTLDRVYFQASGLRRLDMSEYSQSDAIRDLRGETGRSGRLANIVREKPYGVLLLDEFEKAHRQVHDLFLQILDEGYFTDGRGGRVSLDNMIIIATSNAGAKDIFSYVEAGDDLQDRQKDIIDSLVDDGDFRPELINRFDATVIFHPLTADNLIQITKILLAELRERMKEKGFRLDVAADIPAYLVEQGYDPEFGARAIRRVIQDTVENTIADKIINKGLTPGDRIDLSVEDLSGS